MTLIEIFSILIIHWIADFIMQDEKWALGKSVSGTALLKHVITYSLIVWFLMIMLQWYLNGSGLYNLTFSTKFAIITYLFHLLTDYFTSKIVSYRFKKEEPFRLKLDTTIYDVGDIIRTYPNDKTDYIIMEAFGDNYKLKKYNPIPNFGAFTIIGFDQILHYIQLFLTYELLK